MGGTYWYYVRLPCDLQGSIIHRQPADQSFLSRQYLLDDDVEHYNQTEPATSHCAFLPGQPVNVLQVPILLPDSEPIRSRQGVVRNTHTFNTPDYRTMNPEDRFMNPRQPPKPKLPRLRTSLQQPAPAWSFQTSPLSYVTNRSASQPSSAAGKPRGHGSRDSFGSKASRSVSPPRSRDLRAAFRRLNTSTPDLTTNNTAGNEEAVMRPSAAYGPQPEAPCPRDSDPVEKESELPFRRPPADNHGSLSIQDRRALKSKARDPSPFRNPLTVDTRSERSEAFSQNDAVPTLRAIAQDIAVTGDSTTPTPFSFKDKRLPTLPNTPSSVMDEALRDLDDREKALDAENLGSHFSDFSATDESSASYSPPCEKSRFSEWSTETEHGYPDSMMSITSKHAERPLSHASSSTDDAQTPGYLQPSHATECSYPDTPHLTVNSQPSPAVSMPSDSPGLPLPVPRLTVSGSPSELDVAGLSIEDEAGHVETNPKRHAAFFGSLDPVKGLGLSRPGNPAVPLPEDEQRDLPAPPPHVDEEIEVETEGQGQGHDRERKSEQPPPMQEMMDELSYLKNMIQSAPGGMI